MFTVYVDGKATDVTVASIQDGKQAIDSIAGQVVELMDNRLGRVIWQKTRAAEMEVYRAHIGDS